MIIIYQLDDHQKPDDHLSSYIIKRFSFAMLPESNQPNMGIHLQEWFRSTQKEETSWWLKRCWAILPGIAWPIHPTTIHRFNERNMFVKVKNLINQLATASLMVDVCRKSVYLEARIQVTGNVGWQITHHQTWSIFNDLFLVF